MTGPNTESDTLDKDGYHDGSAQSDMVLAAASAELSELVERTRKSLDNAVPPTTRRAYAGDLQRFAAWATTMGLAAMPAAPQTVVLYMRHLADGGARVSSLERALAAIATAHVRAGLPSPWADTLVADMRTALRRELGTRPTKKKAVDDELLRRLLGVLPPSILGHRDRALLTVGWAAALRRSEVVALDVQDVTRAPKGLVLLIRASKTDQEAQGQEVPVFFSNVEAHCPVRALDGWLTAAGVAEGAIFRALGRRGVLGGRLAPAAVVDRVQHWAAVAGLDARDFGAHSLRSGFVTTAARRGRDLDAIMVTTRHRSVATVRDYVQRETIFERAAGEGLL